VTLLQNKKKGIDKNDSIQALALWTIQIYGLDYDKKHSQALQLKNDLQHLSLGLNLLAHVIKPVNNGPFN